MINNNPDNCDCTGVDCDLNCDGIDCDCDIGAIDCSAFWNIYKFIYIFYVASYFWNCIFFL